METKTRRIAVVAVLLLVVLTALPATASAVLSGTNGRIVFASGRASPDGDDSQAKLYLRTVTSSSGAGTVSPTITPAAGQHRHPTWSPDRTQVAYALGGASCNPNCDIFIDNLVTGQQRVVASLLNVVEDRPAWSPDGTRLAYESEVTDGSGQTDILVIDLNDPTVPALNLTNTSAAGAFEGKPAWTPDSQTIYYVTGNPAGSNTDIVRKPATGGTQTPVLNDLGSNEFQPSISPDGQNFCFTLGTGMGFNATAEIFVAPVANPASATNFSDNPGGGDYNCTWSPDGTKVAYVTGIFNAGALVMENFPDDDVSFRMLEDDMGNFDGNPDWAPDGRPACTDSTITVNRNSSASIPLNCADSGPPYERTPLIVDIPAGTEPANGTLGQIQQGPPATVTYTPKSNFTGADSFQIRSRDGIAFGSQRGTVTINVIVPAPGQVAGANEAPVVSKLKIARRIRKGRPLPRLTSKGGSISFTLSEDATATLSFAPAGAGKSARKRGSFKVKARKGTNRVIFRGRISKKRSLSPRRYRLTLVARDSADATSVPTRANFRLLKPKKKR